MFTMNRASVIENPHQGDYLKVLALCSAGVLRSPTIAWILSQTPYNFNTRAAGCNEEYALIYADDALLYWADEIICVEAHHADGIERRLDALAFYKEHTVHKLDIPDKFPFRDKELIKIAREELFRVYGY